jgi:hypothetical protein
MAKPFPPISPRVDDLGNIDTNPAIQLFGRRFFSDQTIPELLLELLLVATSEKLIGKTEIDRDSLLPSLTQLLSWPIGAPLEYAPKARLNLKLFAFLGSSKLDTRHDSHKQHYRDLIDSMSDPKHLSISGTMDSTEVLRTLENLFLGFQSVSRQRTWCSVSFLPVAKELISGESIWQETKAKRGVVNNWDDALEYFSHNQQSFLARGGELLYLQMCNALRQDVSTTRAWMTESSISASQTEGDSQSLHSALTDAFATLFEACPDTVGKLAEFLDARVEGKTAEHTDFKSGQLRYAKCGWCPEESWREGILFAIEFVRICSALVDPVERLEQLEVLCALQVLRSLCAQSARYTSQPGGEQNGAGPLGYVWVISEPAGRHPAIKQISRRNVDAVQRMIYDAVRHPDIRNSPNLAGKDDASISKIYASADSGYGYKLFLSLGKRLGLIVPKRGAGARFVLNEKLLRCLVMSTVRPGQRITYDSFKKLIFAHYGLAVDDASIVRSCLWSGTSRLSTVGGQSDGWLIEMLNASGMLIRLSDSCSLVTNPFGGAGGSL